MDTTKPRLDGERVTKDPEPVRRARFQNLIWRDARAQSTHMIQGPSASPTPPQPDVPAEWLRELDPARRKSS
ncbi:MAG TPA: hypothetical protein VNH13_04305 [Candidatus Acidoferrales bacterium]|jgi:hypothetical protein|nr:hypothetical protein [Candidatus Acidoferrales bacterium]